MVEVPGGVPPLPPPPPPPPPQPARAKPSTSTPNAHPRASRALREVLHISRIAAKRTATARVDQIPGDRNGPRRPIQGSGRAARAIVEIVMVVLPPLTGVTGLTEKPHVLRGGRLLQASVTAVPPAPVRSEERRVGKEC